MILNKEWYERLQALHNKTKPEMLAEITAMQEELVSDRVVVLNGGEHEKPQALICVDADACIPDDPEGTTVDITQLAAAISAQKQNVQASCDVEEGEHLHVFFYAGYVHHYVPQAPVDTADALGAFV